MDVDFRTIVDTSTGGLSSTILNKYDENVSL
jgi:hypothetical protein